MNRRYRLTSAADFQRVWRTGKTYAHPLIICAVHGNELPFSRFGVTTKRGIGNAVVRNRTRRRLREALRVVQPDAAPGFDVIVMARPDFVNAGWPSVLEAVRIVLTRAGLLERHHDHASGSTQPE